MRRGFTLIEVLVVIAVIALLVGILLPALGKARVASRAVKDMVNLRSIGQALQMYVDEHDQFPAFRLGSGEVHEPTGRPRGRWHWAMGDYLDRAPYLPRNEQEAADFANTNDFDRLDNPVFLDPSQTYEDMRSEQTGEIQVLRCGSYGYNYHYLGNTRTIGAGEASNFPVRLAHVRVPFRTVAFANSAGSVGLRRDGYREHAYTLDPPRLDTARNGAERFAHSTGPSPVSTRHGGRGHAALLDGAVRAMRLADLGYEVVDEDLGLVEPDAGHNAWFNGQGSDRAVDGEAEGR